MPEYLKALVAILFLSTFVFFFAKAPACHLAMAEEDFKRRRNLWLAITLSAFLARNYWVHAALAAALIVGYGYRNDRNLPALFFFLLFAVPPFAATVPAAGLFNYLMELDYLRLLALTLLLPAFLALRGSQEHAGFGRYPADWWLTAYLVLLFVLQLDGDSFTNSVRFGVYSFLGAFLPYYVVSRLPRHLPAFRDTAMAFVVAALVLALCAVLEFGKYWLLYAPLPSALGEHWNMGQYLPRGNRLRALASTGHPIALGYVMTVALGLLLFLRSSMPGKSWYLALGLLLLGLLMPLSRGPWVGAVAMAAVFVATRPQLLQKLLVPALLGMLAFPLLFVTPIGSQLIDYLPFIGTVDADTVTYRQHLLDVSLDVIAEKPWFGASDYLQNPAMRELIQGEKIIDVVNSYLGVALVSGGVGLFLFMAFFVSVMLGIRREMRHLSNHTGETYVLGQALLAVMIGILVIIFTASGITIIPIVYWSMAGLGVAYAGMLEKARSASPAADADLLVVPIASGTHDG